ncbi:MAG TPA: hypothetical protein PLB10_17940, partial [Thiolinea sp.]|nr:hypothetical protein [Thiolinea sp.]
MVDLVVSCDIAVLQIVQLVKIERQVGKPDGSGHYIMMVAARPEDQLPAHPPEAVTGICTDSIEWTIRQLHIQPAMSSPLSRLGVTGSDAWSNLRYFPFEE